MQPPGSVLYVPDSMYRPWEPVGATNIGVALGWKDLYESSASWDRVIARLRQYSLASTLQAIGAVSCILNTFRSPDVAQGQSQIISWLFADPPDLGRRFQRWADRHEIDGLPQVPVLFNDLQLITAAKIAIVALDIDAEPPSTSLEPLGEALLMVSDLIDIETTRGLPPNSTLAADRKRWVRYLVPNALFHFSDDFPHSLARSYDLYLTDRPHLKRTAHYVNLPKRFGRITGFDDIFPWALSFAILARWFRCDTRSDPQPGPLDIQEYLSGVKLTDDERTRFLGFVALDPSTARRKLREAGFSRMNLRPFDPLPLADKPLVVINGKAHCPSVRLYRRKLTRGLHHVYAGPSIDERQRRRFLDWFFPHSGG